MSDNQTDATTYPIYIGYDLADTVYPATSDSPCAGLATALGYVLPDQFCPAETMCVSAGSAWLQVVQQQLENPLQDTPRR